MQLVQNYKGNNWYFIPKKSVLQPLGAISKPFGKHIGQKKIRTKLEMGVENMVSLK